MAHIGKITEDAMNTIKGSNSPDDIQRVIRIADGALMDAWSDFRTSLRKEMEQADLYYSTLGTKVEQQGKQRLTQLKGEQQGEPQTTQLGGELQ